MKNVFPFLAILALISCKTEQPITEPPEVALVENSLIAGVQLEGEPLKTYTLEERMDYYNVPGVSIAVVENGKLSWAKGYGEANTRTGTAVDTETLFQAGSISKPVAALCALILVQEGKLSLDEDVNTYLADWKLPESEFTAEEKVTLRRLLTHTAGTTVHGFPGYTQTDTFPTITEVLNGEGNTAPIRVDTIPGSLWRYSGGGYTIMEKMVEDVSGMPLEEFARQRIFDPLKMQHSTYQQPLGEDFILKASAAYDGSGKLIEGDYHNYPEQAAAGLWTTPTDLALYAIEIQQIAGRQKTGILSKEMVEAMLTKHENDWGLGPALSKEGDSLLFGHGGKNAGFTNNFFAFAHQGHAAIVMTNADQGGSLIGEILRGISHIYQWNVRDYKTVKAVEVPEDLLLELTGQYKLGDYPVEIRFAGGVISVVHAGSPNGTELIPVGNLTFVDGQSGGEVIFEIDTDSTEAGILTGGNRFVKVREK